MYKNVYTIEEKQFLLALARQSIKNFLTDKKKLNVDRVSVPKNFLEQRSCFVTLTKDFELRGCIGHLQAIQPLYLDVIEDAYAAAFEDDRFFPLTTEELREITIEISVLTPSEPLAFTSPQNLLDQLTVGVDGVIISRGNNNATYLPQVWDEILDKSNFMSSLCLKAGLEPNDWQKPGLSVATYQVEIMRED